MKQATKEKLKVETSKLQDIQLELMSLSAGDTVTTFEFNKIHEAVKSITKAEEFIEQALSGPTS